VKKLGKYVIIKVVIEEEIEQRKVKKIGVKNKYVSKIR